MKKNLNRLVFILALFINFNAFAQGPYTISGTVIDEKNAPVKGATVFISGSQKITATTNDGKFTFHSIDAGSYQLTVQLLGYHPFTQNVLVQGKPVELKIALKVKPILLNTVKIGKDGAWAKNYERFKTKFLGTSSNAKKCVILNPQVLSFGTTKTTLTAESDEFLVIENKQLGYRIHYLLKDFSLNLVSGVVGYDGDTSFEPLDGTPETRATWDKNRLEAYQGSLMHFLRAVYTNTALEEGFVTNQLYLTKVAGFQVFSFDPRPLKFDTVITVIDTSFIAFKFNPLYIKYDKAQAAMLKTNAKPDATKVSQPPKLDGNIANGSILKLFLKEAIIDNRGSFGDYRTFLRQGYWAWRMVGDQLPFEYQPIIIAN